MCTLVDQCSASLTLPQLLDALPVVNVNVSSVYPPVMRAHEISTPHASGLDFAHGVFTLCRTARVF